MDTTKHALAPQGVLAAAFLVILGSFTVLDPITVASAQPLASQLADGNLVLDEGAEWPTDNRLMERLQTFADEYDKPLVVLSGKRELGNPRNPAPGTQWYFWKEYQAGRGNLAAYPSPRAPHIRGHAADVNVRQPDGSLRSVGLDPRARALLRKHRLVLSVPSEAWHVEPEEVSDWGYWQKP